MLSTIAVITSLLLVGAAVAANGPARPSAREFPITFWAMHYWRDSPEYDRLITDEQYRLIRECNFNLVMGGPLSQAERFGLQCMSDAVSGQEFRELWWTPDEPVTDAQRARIVAAVTAVDRRSPALWGYHLTDEPGTVLYAKVKAVRDIIKSVDPERPVFVNVHPGTDAARYIAEVEPDLCAYDHYPIFEDGAPLDPDVPPGFENSNFLNDLARNRKACLAAGLKFLPTLLCCGHYLDYEVDGVKYHRSYGHVTEARLRWQAYSALAYNAGGLGWFVYFTPGVPEYDEGAVGVKTDAGLEWRPTPTYAWLQRLNREAGCIGAMLQELRSVGTYESEPVYCWQHRGKDELAHFDPEGAVTGVDGGLVTVGEFAGPRGDRTLVIVNRNVNETVEIQPRLDWSRLRRVTLFDRNRLRWTRKPLWSFGEPPPRLSLAPGDGQVLRLKLR